MGQTVASVRFRLNTGEATTLNSIGENVSLQKGKFLNSTSNKTYLDTIMYTVKNISHMKYIKQFYVKLICVLSTEIFLLKFEAWEVQRHSFSGIVITLRFIHTGFD